VDRQPWNKDDPLARYKGESRRANDALQDYYLMGSGRSLAKLLERYRGQSEGKPGVGEPPTRRKATLEGWSVRYQWQARVDRAKELDDQRTQELWEQRQEETRQTGWDKGQELVRRAGEYLKLLPTFMRTTEQEVIDSKTGERVRIITTQLNASFAQITGAIKTGVELQRQAAGMETEHKKISGEVTVTGVTSDDLAKARDRAKALEEELLGDDE